MNPFDSDALWIKSRLFINRALDPERSFDEQAFWACSALELIGKSALSRISPLLIANPMDDGNSLLVASGLISANSTSVQAKTIWSRCARAFKPFSEQEAKKISNGRNEYIHSGTIGFDSIPAEAWWPRYWTLIMVLLDHMDFEISDFVDRSAIKMVENALAKQKNNISRQLDSKIARAQNMLNQFNEGTLSARHLAEWNSYSPHYASYSDVVECPACNGWGKVYGDEIVDTAVEYHRTRYYEEEEITVTLDVATDFFGCDTCHLMLFDYDLIVEASLDDVFQAEGDGDDIPAEPEYNNE